MVITVTKNTSRKKILNAMKVITDTKNKNLALKDFFGKLKRNIDGLAYQKSKRDEWN